MRKFSLKDRCKSEAEFISKLRIHTKLAAPTHNYTLIYNSNNKLAGLGIIGADEDDDRYFVKGYNSEGELKAISHYRNTTRTPMISQCIDDYKLKENVVYCVVYGDGGDGDVELYRVVTTMLLEANILPKDSVTEAYPYSDKFNSTYVLLQWDDDSLEWNSFRFESLNSIPADINPTPISVEALFVKLRF